MDSENATLDAHSHAAGLSELGTSYRRYWPLLHACLVILPDGTVHVYVVDVDGERQVFVTQHSDATLESDLAELDAILESIQIHP